MFDEGTPIFAQLAERLASDILSGIYPEGAQVPSINELAAFYRINPATANRAVAELVAQGVLEKRRGIGMFVAAGAWERIAAERRANLAERYIRPLLDQARVLDLDITQLIQLIEREARS